MGGVKVIARSVVGIAGITLVGRHGEEIDCGDDGVVEGMTGGDAGVVGGGQDARGRWVDDEGCDGEIIRWLGFQEKDSLGETDYFCHEPLHLRCLGWDLGQSPTRSTCPLSQIFE